VRRFIFVIIFSLCLGTASHAVGTEPVVKVDSSGLGTSEIGILLAGTSAATTEEIARRNVAKLLQGNFVEQSPDPKLNLERLGFVCEEISCNFQGIYRSVIRSDVWLQYAERRYDIAVHPNKSPILIEVSLISTAKESSGMMGSEIGELIAKEGPFHDNRQLHDRIARALASVPKEHHYESLARMGFRCGEICEYFGRQRVDTKINSKVESKYYEYRIAVSLISESEYLRAEQLTIK